MASGSLSTAVASSSSGTKAYSYDVFLSFRGEDTRDSFTAYLHDRLTQAQIRTFIDYEEIKKGEELKPEFRRAIKESMGSIIVLSENYATSTWCLDELLLILQQRRECNHFVLPVFYHVEPTDVRNQIGSFAIQANHSSTRWTDDNVKQWKTALMQVADLSGEVVSVVSGPETNILKKIVETIYNKLGPKDVCLPLNITGMVTRYEDVSTWLYQSELQFLVIYGMGGSGKTTLAKYIYNSNWKTFEYVSFVEHIGSRCERPNGLLEVQEQLLKDILGGKERKIPGVFRGTPMIKEALQTKRTLIVLDDIFGHCQLADLLGTGEINVESKIIITTRENPDNWLDFSYRRCQKYEMRLLNNNESSELLCHHAFRSEIPKAGFEGVVLQAIQYCEGNPLALEVLGSYLFKNETIQYWESQLSLFGRDFDSRIRDILGSERVEGLALDMKMLTNEDSACKPSGLKTEALKNMDRLKLLQLNFVELDGSYEDFSEDLRWLCWLGFHLRTIPSELYMGNLVAIDMSYSKLEVFEPPTDIQSLKILNLKDSRHLIEIRNIFMIPNLETLVLWNCYALVNVCKTIGGLRSLALLNMTGCKNLFNQKQINLLPASTSTSGGVITEQPTLSFPVSLLRLFLKDCHLERTDSFPLSFRAQPVLQYLNLGNSRFEFLPCYDHLKNLRVLDLSFCSRLKCLIGLPSTLAELYINGCELLERITFHSHRFTLQDIGYLGCIHLNEVEGFFKLVPIAKLDETDLGHMNWLPKRYQNNEVCLVGDDELTVGRSWHIQMLYEFGIMSTSLPDIKDPNMTPEYISDPSSISSLSFDVPSCPKNKRLKGINVTFKYELSGDDWVWFCKISTTNGFDLNYNPKVFGKPEFGDVCIWLSYWPIGDKLNTGDKVHVSVNEIIGMKVHECGVSLVYANKENNDIEKNNTGWEEILGGDLSGFQLSTGAYYLCRRDYFELTEVRRLTPNWFRTLFGDAIDYTEVRGWRKTGRVKQVNDPSVTELKFVRCIIHGPQLEDVYRIAEMSKSSFSDKNVAFTSSLLEGAITDEAIEEIYDKSFKSGDETLDPYSQGRSLQFHDKRNIKKVEFKLDLLDEKIKQKAMKKVSSLTGVDSISMNMKDKKLTVIGDADPLKIVSKLRKICHTDIVTLVSVGPAKEHEKKDGPAKEHEKKDGPAKEHEKKDGGGDKKKDLVCVIS